MHAVLLDVGADPNARNNVGRTPLSTVRPINARVIELLEDMGFNQ
jgi:hypothetical protein